MVFFGVDENGIRFVFLIPLSMENRHELILFFVGISPSRFYIGMLCPKSKGKKKALIWLSAFLFPFEPPVGIEPTTFPILHRDAVSEKV